MDNDFNNLFDLLTESSGIVSLLKVYKAHERELNPEQTDVLEALYLMEEYYRDYIDFWEKHEIRTPMKIKKAYFARFSEIKHALKSQNVNQQTIALDNAINQWHMDFPVIMHLYMDSEEKDTRLSGIVTNIKDILQRLGRLPKQSPYAEIN